MQPHRTSLLTALFSNLYGFNRVIEGGSNPYVEKLSALPVEGIWIGFHQYDKLYPFNKLGKGSTSVAAVMLNVITLYENLAQW